MKRRRKMRKVILCEKLFRTLRLCLDLHIERDLLSTTSNNPISPPYRIVFHFILPQSEPTPWLGPCRCWALIRVLKESDMDVDSGHSSSDETSAVLMGGEGGIGNGDTGCTACPTVATFSSGFKIALGVAFYNGQGSTLDSGITMSSPSPNFWILLPLSLPSSSASQAYMRKSPIQRLAVGSETVTAKSDSNAWVGGWRYGRSGILAEVEIAVLEWDTSIDVAVGLTYTSELVLWVRNYRIMLFMVMVTRKTSETTDAGRRRVGKRFAMDEAQDEIRMLLPTRPRSSTPPPGVGFRQNGGVLVRPSSVSILSASGSTPSVSARGSPSRSLYATPLSFESQIGIVPISAVFFRWSQ
ncbi:hypothetical protein BYT27DRAFT_7339843 [Phlegmacium glaucopus]|nr:hypothetical protein BYT27DRAFT_7339843 [Phlegmacium glaucopus]